MKIIFMGTPEFAVQSLDAIHEMGHEIILVVSQEDKPKGRGNKLVETPVKARALELGLEVFQPKKIKEAEAVETIRRLKPDLIVVTAYGQILSREILEIPKHGCINVHASLLPKYRGAAPINFAIINGETITGITTMVMEEGLDTGDMLVKDQLDIAKEDTSATLFVKLAELSKKTLKKTIDLLEKNRLNPKKQDEAEASYTTMLKKDLGHINWNRPATDIVNLWRGTQPWPGVFSLYKDEVVKLSDLVVCDVVNGSPGEIVAIGNDYIQVASGCGSVKIYSIQFPNRKRISVAEYLKGNVVEKNGVFV